jgi:membrane-bound lytic murein transglycosylase D
MMRSAVAVVLAALGVAFATPASAASAASAATDVLFPRPPGIHARIKLWTRVYSEVASNGGLIHDAEELDVVYEVIRWPKTLTPGEQEARIARTKKHYAAIVERLADGKTSLTPEERRVLALFPPGVSRATLAAASERIRFQRGLADRFRDGVIRSGQWEPHIREVLRDNGVPQELAALPHVESSYNPVAYSHAGAAGLWQFMPGTGKRFLRIDRAVDERFDPWRASEAAAKLLKENHRITGHWPLAVTAYNHGAGGMLRAVKQLGTTDIATIIDRYESDSFGFASRNFYTEFLAAYDVERAAARHFGVLSRERHPDDEVVVTRHPTSASALARAFGVDPGLLREMNLGLRDAVWNGRLAVPAGYAVRLPRVAGRAPAEQILASLPRSSGGAIDDDTSVAADGRSPSRYRVRRGDTMGKVAQKHGVSTASLAKANGLKASSHLRVGQTLRIPGTTKVAVAKAATTTAGVAKAQPAVATTKAKATKTAAKKPAARSHTVKKGETLSAIARRSGVSVQKLASANNISSSHRLKAGQRLRIPD